MDREKVIKGLECHQIDNNHRINCTDCPYYVDDDNHIRCVNDLHDEALELLKEQEPIMIKTTMINGTRMVIITTMDALPDYCYDCPCHNGEDGRCRADANGRYTSEYRPYWCPLKEVNNNA